MSSCTLQAQNHDIEILKEINLNRNKSLDPLFLTITNSAGPLTFGIPILLLIIALTVKNKRLRNKSYYLLLSVFTAVIFTNILKYTIDRPRPFVTYSFIEKVTAGGSPSFPSGHTSDAFVLAMALSLAFPRYWIIFFSFLWAFAMGYSRMSLGVHYPADVLSGASIGIFSATFIYFLKKHKWLTN
jgi:undecaprenyl-diphosphatase